MPEQLPQWNAVGVEPPQSLKDSGWQPGMKPSAQHMNWLLNRAYKCIEELRQAGGNVDDLIQTVTSLEQTVDTHLADAVKHNNYGIATGTNALTVTLPNAPTILKEGFTLRFKNTTENTGAVTLNVNGLGAKSILKNGGTALSASNLKAGGIYTICYSGTAFFLQGESGGDPVANGSQTFTTPGTYSFTVPEGVTRIFYRMWGGGGGGGGSCAYGTYVGGGGGGAGAYTSGFLNVVPNSVLSVVVGAGGAGGLPNTDTNQAHAIQGGKGSNSSIQGAPYQACGGGAGASSSLDGVGRGGLGGWTSQGASGMTGPNTSEHPKQGGPTSLSLTVEGRVSAFISGTDGGFSNYQSGGGGGAGGCSDSFSGNLPQFGSIGGGEEQNKYNFIKGSIGGSGSKTTNGNNGNIGGSGGGGGCYYNYNTSHKIGGKGGDGKVIIYW